MKNPASEMYLALYVSAGKKEINPSFIIIIPLTNGPHSSYTENIQLSQDAPEVPEVELLQSFTVKTSIHIVCPGDN